MNYKTMWAELEGHIKGLELVYDELGTPTMKNRADAARMIHVVMKILERDQKAKPRNKNCITYDFENGKIISVVNN